MIHKTSLIFVLLAGFTPLLATASTLINDAFDTTDILFDIGGVQTVEEAGTFSTTPLEGCTVNYTVPVSLNAGSVDVLAPSHPFGPAVNFFGGATASSTLETQLDTIIGQTYNVLFNLKQIGTFSDHKVIASVAGATSGEVGPGTHGFSFVADSTTTTLTFNGIICTSGSCNGGSDIALDSLTVTTDGVVAACGGDEDADGVADIEDLCPNSIIGALVDATGCSINQYCGCDDFSNHGGYVSCTARSAEAFLQDDLITQSDKRKIIRVATKSSCGKPTRKHKKSSKWGKTHDKASCTLKHSSNHSSHESSRHSRKTYSKTSSSRSSSKQNKVASVRRHRH